MPLVDDLPLITSHRDIEHYIDRFRKWDADDKKDVSPVFTRELLGFVILFVDNLSLYIKQQDNTVSPTVADSFKKVYTKPWAFSH